MVFFYFDPAKMRTPGEMGAADPVLAAWLFFEDNSLRETALSCPRANTNFPTIMISKRIADFIRAARRIRLNGGKARPAGLGNANLLRPAILVKPLLLL